MSDAGCPGCDCIADAPAHALVAALQVDDMDAALDSGLLHIDGCPSCTPACTSALLSVRDERRGALDARERFRARQRRLDARAAQRDAARQARPLASAAPALPEGVAAALQRALAKAGVRR